MLLRGTELYSWTEVQQLSPRPRAQRRTSVPESVSTSDGDAKATAGTTCEESTSGMRRCRGNKLSRQPSALRGASAGLGPSGVSARLRPFLLASFSISWLGGSLTRRVLEGCFDVCSRSASLHRPAGGRQRSPGAAWTRDTPALRTCRPSERFQAPRTSTWRFSSASPTATRLSCRYGDEECSTLQCTCAF